MRLYRIILILFTLITCDKAALSQTIKPGDTEDSTLGPRPDIKIESISPAGHCDNQQLSFFAVWADHYEISKRRCDTGWINENRNVNTSWVSEKLKPGVTGMIYKRLDEQGTYQFFVTAFKGSRYRKSEVITLQPCVTDVQK